MSLGRQLFRQVMRAPEGRDNQSTSPEMGHAVGMASAKRQGGSQEFGRGQIALVLFLVRLTRLLRRRSACIHQEIFSVLSCVAIGGYDQP